MATWSSIQHKASTFYHCWKAEIQIYGIGLLLTLSGLLTGRDKAAGIVFGLMILYDLMRRFGEPYRLLGEQEFARRQQARRQQWREHTSDLMSRFLVGSPPSPPATPPAATRLIPAPGTSADDLPESPTSPLPETDHPPEPPPIPPVTHQT